MVKKTSRLKHAKKLNSNRSKRARTVDAKKTAKRVYPPTITGLKKWKKNPRRSDIRGVDTKTIIGSSRPKPNKKPYKDFNFQMKDKKYRASEVIQKVKKNLRKTDTPKLNAEIDREYRARSKQAMEQNPHWKLFYPTKEKYLKSQKLSKSDIRKAKHGELIQQEFNKTINRRVKAERAVTDGSSLKNISDKTLIENLNVIRGVRKHEVGMKYKKNKK